MPRADSGFEAQTQLRGFMGKDCSHWFPLVGKKMAATLSERSQ
jgi:hypothetical protein